MRNIFLKMGLKAKLNSSFFRHSKKVYHSDRVKTQICSDISLNNIQKLTHKNSFQNFTIVKFKTSFQRLIVSELKFIPKTSYFNVNIYLRYSSFRLGSLLKGNSSSKTKNSFFKQHQFFINNYKNTTKKLQKDFFVKKNLENNPVKTGTIQNGSFIESASNTKKSTPNLERFWNFSFDKGRLKTFVSWFLKNYGQKKTIELLEQLKELGFGYATKAGISLGIDDLRIPPQKMDLIYQAENHNYQGLIQYNRGEITGIEQFQRLIDTWHQTSESLKQEVIRHFEATDIFNPVYMMAFSGARGNISQVRQLVGMRGLMADPQGRIIDFPIRSNFREGLTLTEYIISSYGARKGIVDTALRTANAGYLTRRLVDVAQHVIVSEFDCGATRGIYVFEMKEGTKTIYSFQNRLIGRVLAQNIFSGNTQIASKDQEISPDLAKSIAKITKKALIRSPLTCETRKLVCQLCYGWSLSHGHLVSIGDAVGIIAAQSIGEPGTQLTMRTFHTGGVFSGGFTEQIIAQYDGIVEYASPIPGICIRTPQGDIAFLTKGEGSLIFNKQNTLETNSSFSEQYSTDSTISKLHSFTEIYKIPAYSVLFARNKQKVFKKQTIAQISSFSTQKAQRGDAEQTIFSEFQGQLYQSNIDIIEKINEYEDLSLEAWDWGYIWILAGKIYQFPIESNFFPHAGDLIKKNSVVNKISWVVPQTCFLKNHTNNDFGKCADPQDNLTKQSLQTSLYIKSSLKDVVPKTKNLNTIFSQSYSSDIQNSILLNSNQFSFIRQNLETSRFKAKTQHKKNSLSSKKSIFSFSQKKKINPNILIHHFVKNKIFRKYKKPNRLLNKTRVLPKTSRFRTKVRLENFSFLNKVVQHILFASFLQKSKSQNKILVKNSKSTKGIQKLFFNKKFKYLMLSRQNKYFARLKTSLSQKKSLKKYNKMLKYPFKKLPFSKQLGSKTHSFPKLSTLPLSLFLQKPNLNKLLVFKKLQNIQNVLQCIQVLVTRTSKSKSLCKTLIPLKHSKIMSLRILRHQLLIKPTLLDNNINRYKKSKLILLNGNYCYPLQQFSNKQKSQLSKISKKLLFSRSSHFSIPKTVYKKILKRKIKINATRILDQLQTNVSKQITPEFYFETKYLEPILQREFLDFQYIISKNKVFLKSNLEYDLIFKNKNLAGRTLFPNKNNLFSSPSAHKLNSFEQKFKTLRSIKSKTSLNKLVYDKKFLETSRFKAKAPFRLENYPFLNSSAQKLPFQSKLNEKSKINSIVSNKLQNLFLKKPILYLDLNKISYKNLGYFLFTPRLEISETTRFHKVVFPSKLKGKALETKVSKITSDTRVLFQKKSDFYDKIFVSVPLKHQHDATRSHFSTTNIGRNSNSLSLGNTYQWGPITQLFLQWFPEQYQTKISGMFTFSNLYKQKLNNLNQLKIAFFKNKYPGFAVSGQNKILFFSSQIPENRMIFYNKPVKENSINSVAIKYKLNKFNTNKMVNSSALLLSNSSLQKLFVSENNCFYMSKLFDQKVSSVHSEKFSKNETNTIISQKLFKDFVKKNKLFAFKITKVIKSKNYMTHFCNFTKAPLTKGLEFYIPVRSCFNLLENNQNNRSFLFSSVSFLSKKKLIPLKYYLSESTLSSFSSVKELENQLSWRNSLKNVSLNTNLLNKPSVNRKRLVTKPFIQNKDKKLNLLKVKLFDNNLTIKTVNSEQASKYFYVKNKYAYNFYIKKFRLENTISLTHLIKNEFWWLPQENYKILTWNNANIDFSKYFYINKSQKTPGFKNSSKDLYVSDLNSKIIEKFHLKLHSFRHTSKQVHSSNILFLQTNRQGIKKAVYPKLEGILKITKIPCYKSTQKSKNLKKLFVSNTSLQTDLQSRFKTYIGTKLISDNKKSKRKNFISNKGRSMISSKIAQILEYSGNNSFLDKNITLKNKKTNILAQQNLSTHGLNQNTRDYTLKSHAKKLLKINVCKKVTKNKIVEKAFTQLSSKQKFISLFTYLLKTKIFKTIKTKWPETSCFKTKIHSFRQTSKQLDSKSNILAKIQNQNYFINNYAILKQKKLLINYNKQTFDDILHHMKKGNISHSFKNQHCNITIQQGWVYVPHNLDENLPDSLHLLETNSVRTKMLEAPSYKNSKKPDVSGITCIDSAITHFWTNNNIINYHKMIINSGKSFIDDLCFDKHKIYIEFIPNLIRSDSNYSSYKTEILETSRFKAKAPMSTNNNPSLNYQNNKSFCLKQNILNFNSRYIKINEVRHSKNIILTNNETKNVRVTLSEENPSFRKLTFSKQHSSNTNSSSISQNFVARTLYKIPFQTKRKTIVPPFYVLIQKMTHKTLPSLYDSKKRIYTKQQKCIQPSFSLLMYNNFHSHVLNKQTITKNLISQFAGIDLKISYAFTKSKNFNETNSFQKIMIKGKHQTKASFRTNFKISSSNEITYFSKKPIQFFPLFVNFSYPSNFHYSFKLPSFNFHSKYSPLRVSNVMNFINIKAQSMMLQKIKVSLENERFLNNYVPETHRLRTKVPEFNSQTLGFERLTTRYSFNLPCLDFSLSQKMAYLANQRLFSNYFLNKDLKSLSNYTLTLKQFHGVTNSKSSHFRTSSSFSSLSLSESFSSFPLSMNEFVLNNEKMVLKNKPFAKTSFFSPLEGEVLSDNLNAWSNVSNENRRLILTINDLFSYFLPNTAFLQETSGFKTKVTDIRPSQDSVSESFIKYKNKVYKIKGLKIGFVSHNSKLNLGSFFIYGDLISPNVGIDQAGQVIHVSQSKITLRRAQPIFVSPKGILHKYNGDFISQNAPVTTLPFQTLKTGDIVQGIPKVEQYFEARTTKRGRLFRDSLPNLLQGLFESYQAELPQDQAVRQSILKIQQILVDGVQRVYRSQGVSIADKHLEIIVRQMTSKVQIVNGGQTGFFPGELVDLEFVEHVNTFLMKKIHYEPIVLGITRSSLEVESFLSAASFQQTTKVLSRAAIYGKRDFLKGLKENIMVGNLIPAGTGFLTYVNDLEKRFDMS